MQQDNKKREKDVKERKVKRIRKTDDDKLLNTIN